jgi:hypothetical protein
MRIGWRSLGASLLLLIPSLLNTIHVDYMYLIRTCRITSMLDKKIAEQDEIEMNKKWLISLS